MCLVIVSSLKDCTIRAASGNHNYLPYSKGEKTKWCMVVETEEAMLTRECLSFDTGSYGMQVVDGSVITSCDIIHI